MYAYKQDQAVMYLWNLIWWKSLTLPWDTPKDLIALLWKMVPWSTLFKSWHMNLFWKGSWFCLELCFLCITLCSSEGGRPFAACLRGAKGFLKTKNFLLHFFPSYLVQGHKRTSCQPCMVSCEQVLELIQLLQKALEIKELPLKRT